MSHNIIGIRINTKKSELAGTRVMRPGERRLAIVEMGTFVGLMASGWEGIKSEEENAHPRPTNLGTHVMVGRPVHRHSLPKARARRPINQKAMYTVKIPSAMANMVTRLLLSHMAKAHPVQYRAHFHPLDTIQVTPRIHPPLTIRIREQATAPTRAMQSTTTKARRIQNTTRATPRASDQVPARSLDAMPQPVIPNRLLGREVPPKGLSSPAKIHKH